MTARPYHQRGLPQLYIGYGGAASDVTYGELQVAPSIGPEAGHSDCEVAGRLALDLQPQHSGHS